MPKKILLKIKGSLLSAVLIALASCAHPNRASPGTLRHLTKKNEPFVLVFGSLSTSAGTLAVPTIRFSRQVNRTAPMYLLKTLTITSGDRFYAILQPPKELPYLDEFYLEVGSPSTGFDRITYIRLHQPDGPAAMYVGELQMSPAPKRETQGPPIAVTVHDEFQDASRELKRLYPDFEGTINRSVASHNPTPTSPPPDRVK